MHKRSVSEEDPPPDLLPQSLSNCLHSHLVGCHFLISCVSFFPFYFSTLLCFFTFFTLRGCLLLLLLLWESKPVSVSEAGTERSSKWTARTPPPSHLRAVWMREDEGHPWLTESQTRRCSSSAVQTVTRCLVFAAVSANDISGHLQ